MAVRIRKDGRVLCAAMHPAEDGDIYVDDPLHYYLSCEAKVLVTEPHSRHKERGEWWWVNRVPADIQIEDFYLEQRPQSQHIRELIEPVEGGVILVDQRYSVPKHLESEYKIRHLTALGPAHLLSEMVFIARALIRLVRDRVFGVTPWPTR